MTVPWWLVPRWLDLELARYLTACELERGHAGPQREDRTMSKLYRKKPVVIEAMQFKARDGAALLELQDWLTAIDASWALDGAELEIRTLEDGHDGRAKHVATDGDWIIRGVAGEVYACKPEIFEQTYDRMVAE